MFSFKCRLLHPMAERAFCVCQLRDVRVVPPVEQATRPESIFDRFCGASHRPRPRPTLCENFCVPSMSNFVKRSAGGRSLFACFCYIFLAGGVSVNSVNPTPGNNPYLWDCLCDPSKGSLARMVLQRLVNSNHVNVAKANSPIQSVKVDYEGRFWNELYNQAFFAWSEQWPRARRAPLPMSPSSQSHVRHAFIVSDRGSAPPTAVERRLPPRAPPPSVAAAAARSSVPSFLPSRDSS